MDPVCCVLAPLGAVLEPCGGHTTPWAPPCVLRDEWGNVGCAPHTSTPPHSWAPAPVGAALHFALCNFISISLFWDWARACGALACVCVWWCAFSCA